MLDQIKKYAPKTALSLSKVIAARENSVKKISDYEKQIKELDEQIMFLETESCKNPNNPKTNEKLELLSAKRFGLHYRYEALKSGAATFYTKNDLDEILNEFKFEYTNSMIKILNENGVKSRELRESFNQKVRDMEKELKVQQYELEKVSNVLNNVIAIVSQTLNKNYLSLGLESNEIEDLMKKSSLPYHKETNKAL